MKKNGFILKILLTLAALLATCQLASAQIILLSNFTDLSAQDYSPFTGSWNGGSPATDQYIQNINSITIAPVNGGDPDGTGNLYADFQQIPDNSPGDPSSLNLTGATIISLSAELNSGNTDTAYTIFIYDSSLDEIGQATFASSLFNTSLFTTADVPLTLEGGGDITEATYWELAGDGIRGDSVNASFEMLEAIPEPSSYALFGTGLLFLFWVQRRKILKLAPRR